MELDKIKGLLEFFMDLKAPPITAAPFTGSPRRLSIIIPPKQESPNTLAPAKSTPVLKFRNSMKSPTYKQNPVINEQEELESPASPAKRKLQARVSCVPTFPSSTVSSLEAFIHTATRASKNRLATEVQGIGVSRDHVRASPRNDSDYHNDRLLKHFDDKTLKRQKEHLRSSWHKTTKIAMANLLSRIHTVQKGTSVLIRKTSG